MRVPGEGREPVDELGAVCGVYGGTRFMMAEYSGGVSVGSRC